MGERRLITYAYLTGSFFPKVGPYDIKNNPDYNTAADKPDEAGNWFFGAAAHQMGLSLTEALTAGSIVQQYQNFDSTTDSYSELASNMIDAFMAMDGSLDITPSILN